MTALIPEMRRLLADGRTNATMMYKSDLAAVLDAFEALVAAAEVVTMHYAAVDSPPPPEIEDALARALELIGEKP